MKRTLLLILAAIVVAGWLGTLIARDPGYVLIAYDGATIQSGLWVMLGLLAALVVGFYYLVRIVKSLLQSGGYLRSFRTGRQKARSADLTARGLTFFQEGEFERAIRFLKSGAAMSDTPAVNYVYAARAANALDRVDERDEFLRLAREAGAVNSVAIARAEMARFRRDWDEVLASLSDLKPSEVVTRLRSDALIAKRDWQGLAEIMPQLARTTDRQELLALQKRVALDRLTADSVTDDGLTVVFRKLPDELKRDEAVLTTYCRRLASEKEAESVLRGALGKTWSPELLDAYGALGRETLDRRIKAAEGWLRKHGDDAALQLCLGRLYEANGQRDLAKAAYQKSVDLDNTHEASEALGRMLAFDGDYKKSNEYLGLALKLSG